jgi:1,2-diacylglycerol 3-alpha-glucosyltransferase
LCGFGEQVHAIGIFSLLFAFRLAARRKDSRVTVGIYHQNEFAFAAPPFHFVREAQRLFAQLPAGNVVFFNEGTRNSYGDYFHRDYSGSTIVPIGIDLSSVEVTNKLADTNRIVSIGNLEAFKTYNAHMIEVVAKLVVKYPNLRYEIYGTGKEEPALRALVARLHMEEHVQLLGALPYADLVRTLETATVFVGSGTALIEAAALGVPAIIGIESIPTPETYGLLSDVGGLSYNEDNLPTPKVSMQDLVDRLLADAEYRLAMGQACRAKSHMFSVTATVEGLLSLDQTASTKAPRLSSWELVRLAISLALMALADRLGVSSAFAERRNQSF